MSISFSCPCGMNLQAKEQYAGRRMKCPSCQKVLTIPTPAAAEAPAAPPPPPDEPAPLFTPHTPPAMDISSLEVEEEVPKKAAAAVPRATPVPEISNPWVDRSLEQRPTPWQGDDAKRYGGATEEGVRSSGLWATMLLVALVLGGIAAGWYYWPQVSEYVRTKAEQRKAASPL